MQQSPGPTVFVTTRPLQNGHTGIDLSVPEYQEIRGKMMSGHVEYSILVVTQLAVFKSAKHKSEDNVQFMEPDPLVSLMSRVKTFPRRKKRMMKPKTLIFSKRKKYLMSFLSSVHLKARRLKRKQRRKRVMWIHLVSSSSRCTIQNNRVGRNFGGLLV
uniref:Uncharacterized protein n=1 Tax=Laticauda laticaudata TaxID=8630 RepID=A0A8C5RG19_LATLA